MVVLNDICEKCNKVCNSIHFQRNFKNWTSDNDDLDKFIQDTQLSANFNRQILEWIPYNKFYDIEYITKGGFGKVYKANWIDGPIRPIDNWDNSLFKKFNNMFRDWNVALKSLNNSKNVTLEFINEVFY